MEMPDKASIEIIVSRAKILEIAGNAATAITVHPTSAKTSNGVMVTRTPYLLIIMQEGNRPLLSGIKAFRFTK